MAHLLLGSVAETLVSTAPCAVLTVRGGADMREFRAEGVADLVPA